MHAAWTGDHRRADSKDLHQNDLFFVQQPLIPQPEEDLCHSDHIPFTILNYPLQVVVLIINITDHAAINIVFGRWDTQNMGYEPQGGIMFEIPEFPEY